ncbi:lipopolysaccharide biosynthesis protein [Nocardioides dongxiaopingii]|uniref:lipopolysaccharide biosynthesis protein n=1 Tax=Nocardioides dongxiaopingii TaxID=2576036 RepID=UPI0010C76DBC|nr:oligosaccharide flippase family protein [Nocardioides dongxiaopingii]
MTMRVTLLGATTVRFAVLVAAFVTSVLVARNLGAEARGIFQIVLTTSLLVASMGGLSGELGFAELLTRRGAMSRQRVLGTLSYCSVLWGIILGFLALATGLGAHQLGGLQLDPLSDRTGLLLVGGFVTTTVANTWLQRALHLQGRAAVAAACSLAEVLVALIVVLHGLASDSLSLQRVLGGTLAGSALAALLALTATRSPISSVDFAVLARGLRAGVKFHLSQVALQMLTRLDILLLGLLAGAASVGHYAVAVSITAPLAVLASSMASTFLNRQFVDSDSEAAEFTLKLVVVTAVLVGAFALVVAVVAWPAIPALWGEAFTDSRVVLVVLLPGVVALAAQRPLGHLFVRHGAARAMTSRALVALAVSVVLGLALIPPFGAVGAAAACTCAYLVYAAISWRHFTTLTDHTTGDLWQAFNVFDRTTANRWERK